MKESEVQQIVDKYKDEYIKLLGLEKWIIHFYYGQTISKFRSDCLAHINYKSAIITFSPEKLTDEETVKAVLLHELIHCIVSTFRTYETAAIELIPSLEERRAVYPIFIRASEEVVCDFVRIIQKMQNISIH